MRILRLGTYDAPHSHDFARSTRCIVGTGPDLVSLDDALNELSALDARKAQVVERFGALSVEETAEVLKVATDTLGLLAPFLVSQLLGNCFQRGTLEEIFGVLAVEKDGIYFLPQVFIWPARCASTRGMTQEQVSRPDDRVRNLHTAKDKCAPRCYEPQ